MAASPPPHAAASAAASGCSFRYCLLPKEPRRAVGSARLRCTPRRSGAAGWHPAAVASRQHTAARALLPRHLGPVVLHRRDDCEREIQGAAPGRRLGAVALHAAPLWCCWLASSGSGKQAARMQWFQAAPAHWRGSELLLYVSLAHGQQHRHQTSAATTAAAEEHRTPLTEGLHVRVSLRQCWAARGKEKSEITSFSFFSRIIY